MLRMVRAGRMFDEWSVEHETAGFDRTGVVVKVIYWGRERGLKDSVAVAT